MSSARLSAVSRLQLPEVWQVRDLAAQEKVLPCGHAALDAQLPGGGWPVGAAVEVLQERPAQHVWRLVLPALAQAAAQSPGPVVLVNAPHEPFGPSLQAQGLPPSRLLWVKAQRAAARLWAAEQALRCADVLAVLAWLPQVKSAELRRLQLAASQHDKLLFVLRPLAAAGESSPARLRLQLEGAQELRVRILKRRGPPLLQPLELAAHPQRLAALLQARRRTSPTAPILLPKDRSHVLDRTEALAG